MPKPLVLSSLAIRRYRGIDDLKIGRIGRVNLFSGKNNVGKSSVLEALRLYAQPGSLFVLENLLETREDIDPIAEQLSRKREDRPLPVERLFFGRRAAPEVTEPIEIGPVDDAERLLKIGPIWHLTQRKSPMPVIRPNGPASPEFVKQTGLIYWMGDLTWTLLMPIPGDPDLSRFGLMTNEGMEDSARIQKKVSHVGPNGLSAESLAFLWDNITLTRREDDLLAALCLICPVERIVFKRIDKDSMVRTPFVKIPEHDEPIPIRNLGDGMSRLLSITLGLINAEDGFLLLDEAENGLHYSVHADLWRLIFRTAARLNVQVFATTHSWDCVEGFQVAASESKEEENFVIRLARKGDRLLVGEFDDESLEIAVEAGIEVR